MVGFAKSTDIAIILDKHTQSKAEEMDLGGTVQINQESIALAIAIFCFCHCRPNRRCPPQVLVRSQWPGPSILGTSSEMIRGIA